MSGMPAGFAPACHRCPEADGPVQNCGAGPGDKGPAPEPGRGDGEGGGSTGFSLRTYLTLATASARPLLIETQTPECSVDWRLR